ncbi:MAG: T9SS type A sorting domain-containing protein [Saprospiraceae bacterium]
MKQFLLLLLLLSQQILFSQTDSLVIHGNNIEALLNSNGSLFWDGENGHFIAGEDGRPTIRAAGLWLAGADAGGNLKGAIQMYNADGRSDFVPGLIDDTLNTENWNRIWKVTGEDILLHIRDIKTDYVIDDTIPSIFGWPGRGNPFFEQFNGFPLPDISRHRLAPFYDGDLDGIYEPQFGDFPMNDIRNCGSVPVPAEFAWFTFHDNTNHTESGMLPMNIEISTEVTAYRCTGNEFANNSILLSYKITNMAQEDIDSCYFGMFFDFQIGCPDDDYVATIPEKNIFYVYNSDGFDEDCGDFIGFHENPPVVAVTLLRGPGDEFLSELPLSVVMPIYDGTTIPGQAPPEQPVEYYNYLSGSWKDGTPLTNGGTGYNPGSTDFTNFIFPGRPGKDGYGWTEPEAGTTPGRRRVIASYGPFTLQPNAVNAIYVIITQLPAANGPHLANLNTVYDSLFEAFGFFYNGCIDPTPAYPKCTEDIEIPPLPPDPPPPPLPEEFIISPNPVSETLQVQIRDPRLVERLSVYDATGRLVFERKDLSDVLDIGVGDWPKGTYFVRLEKGEEQFVKGFVVMRR